MTDKEIRALIERRRKDWRYGNSVEAKYKAEECDDILELMDEQEEPVSKDYIERYKNITQSDAFKSAYENKSLGEVMSVEGEKPVSEDIEEAAKRYALNNTPYEDCTDEMSDAFKAGAKWHREQMMAKAIDGKVLINGMGNPILHLWDKGRHLIDKKVKVIVIKED